MKAYILSDLHSVHRREDLDRPGPLEFHLTEPLVVEIDGVRYQANAGSTTDGASTPRILRSLVPRIGRHVYGAIFHDSAYRGVLYRFDTYNSNEKLDVWEIFSPTREWSDRAFMAVMVAANTGWMTRKMAFWAVRILGRSAFKG